MDSLALRRDIFTSNLPSSEKSALSRVLSRIRGGASTLKTHAVSTEAIIREGAESAVVGAAIGAAEAYFGAQVTIPVIDQAVPVEAIAVGIGYGAAFFFPDETITPTLRRAGNTAVAIWAARAAHNYVAANPEWNKSGATTWAGDADIGVDGIVDAARNIP